MSHPIDQHALPGIGPGRRTRLSQAGILTLEDLVAAGVDKVGALPHLPPSVAAAAIDAARAILAAPPPEVPAQEEPPVVKPPTPEPEPAVDPDPPVSPPGWKPVERLRDALHQVESYADKAPKGKARDRVHKALGKLDRSLLDLSTEAADLSKKQRRKLKDAFSETEKTLDRLVGRKAKDKRLAKARDALDSARKAVKKALD